MTEWPMVDSKITGKAYSTFLYSCQKGSKIATKNVSSIILVIDVGDRLLTMLEKCVILWLKMLFFETSLLTSMKTKHCFSSIFFEFFVEKCKPLLNYGLVVGSSRDHLPMTLLITATCRGFLIITQKYVTICLIKWLWCH